MKFSLSLLLAGLLPFPTLFAGSATWNLNPTSGDWNTAATAGTVFTVINNTAVTQINGTFSNLPDGGTITVGSNTFQANYEGGDGNDLTLTVQ